MTSISIVLYALTIILNIHEHKATINKRFRSSAEHAAEQILDMSEDEWSRKCIFAVLYIIFFIFLKN